MKKCIILMLTTLFALVAFAQKTNDAMTMEGYSQGWSDSKASIRIKNNTADTVRSVSFVVYYYDMHGKMLDYKDFTEAVEIAPGLTKTLDIEPFEHERRASYYRSEASITYPYKFDVKFELKNYIHKLPAKAAAVSHELVPAEDGKRFGVAFLLILSVIGVFVVIFLLIHITNLALERGRNPLLWIMLGMVATPLVPILLLRLLGDADS